MYLEEMHMTIQQQEIKFEFIDSDNNFKFTTTLLQSDSGVQIYRISMKRQQYVFPKPVIMKWYYPTVDIAGYWDAGSGRDKGLRIDFQKPIQTKSTSLAPVCCLYNESDINKVTFALSDAMNTIALRAGVQEESANIEFYTEFFIEASPPIDEYIVDVRIDRRSIRYEEAINDVAQWWATQPGYEPAAVPEIAKMPMYSTWYSFHQNVDPNELLQQCYYAKKLGCEAIIVDDGWQTINSERGYAYCGDWKVSTERIPNMKQFVQDVQNLGMKFLLWYSVPFVGKKSQVWSTYEGKYLNDYDVDTSILDPRFPEVREYLISIYEKALLDWNLDGFKLDFVDSFVMSEELKYSIGEGRDYDSVPEAVDQLLSDTICRLQAIKPDIMIEFRQQYIGPMMRKYGNMFRVADCPNNYSQNRIGSLDIRLLAGITAVHSDMMMWHKDEKPENVALQFIHALFSVPQVSVKLHEMSKEQYEVIEFWLNFWIKHKETLLSGKLIAYSPHYLYPVVNATTKFESITVLYNSQYLKVLSMAQREIIINSNKQETIIIDFTKSVRGTSYIHNCFGELISNIPINFEAGIQCFNVPISGMLSIEYD